MTAGAGATHPLREAAQASADAPRSRTNDAPVTTFVITSLAPGGAQTQLVAISRYLRSCGWDTEVVSLLPPTLFIAELQAAGIPLWSAGIPRRVIGLGGLAALLRVLRHLRARKPDVLCTFMFHANVVGRLLAPVAGVPAVVSSVRNEYFGPRWRQWLEARTQALADVTVVNADAVAATLAAQGVVPRERCRVIPNAVDLARFSPPDRSRRDSTRRSLRIPPGAFLWLAMGRLEPQKDHAALLRALALVRARCPSARLAVAGDGPLREALRQQSAEMSVGDAVSWLGFRDDSPDLLAAADAFVLSSRWEGSPNAILEASAVGLPVVATDVGGVRELLRDGVSGFLVPPGDPGALAAAMTRLMALPGHERRQMGDRGRRAIGQRHDAVTVLEQWRQLLTDVWQAKGR